MFVWNRTMNKYFIDGEEVTKEEYESRMADFLANYVPPEPETDPELTDTEALEILLGGAV